MTTMSHVDRPTIELRLRSDGSGEVIVDGVSEPIHAPELHEARQLAMAQVQRLAASRGECVRFASYDPEGHWQLVMDPDGRVREDRTGTSDAGPGRSAPEAVNPEPGTPEPVTPEPGTPSSRTPRADTRAPVTGDRRTTGYRPRTTPPVVRPASTRPTTEPSTVRAFDSGYVMSTIVPVTRIARSTRGVRGLLGIGPSKRELADRADRAAACQTFGRPVTIVVADPRGGSGKTTTSVLLAGAFGNARGGGVLVVENHELRGTMHLRTDSQAKDRTIRDLLQVHHRAAAADDVVRLGDLAAYMRHQIAGQFDVLVSATKGDRALDRSEFESVHDLGARFYEVIIIDTANNESAENWQAAMARADSLVVPLKWRNDYSLPAIEMLEELEGSGDERLRDLVRRAVVVASHNQGDLDHRCRTQLMPYFTERTQAVIEIGPDTHIAEGNVIQHDQLSAATRHQADRLAAEVATAVALGRR